MKKIMMMVVLLFFVSGCDAFKSFDTEPIIDDSCNAGYTMEAGKCVEVEEEDRCVAGYEWIDGWCQKIPDLICEDGYIEVNGACEVFVLTPVNLSFDNDFWTWYFSDLEYEYYIMQIEDVNADFCNYYIEYKRFDEDVYYEEGDCTNYGAHYFLEREPGPDYAWELWDYKRDGGTLYYYTHKHSVCNADKSSCWEEFLPPITQTFKPYNGN